MEPHSFVKFLITWLQGFHRTQIKTLAVLVFALMCNGCLDIACLGRALPARTAEKHKIEKVVRFLGNNRVPTKELAKALARTMIGPRKVVLVAIDWTDLHDSRHQVLVAGITAR